MNKEKQIAISLSLKCDRCGKELRFFQAETNTIVIKPCVTCMERIYDNGFKYGQRFAAYQRNPVVK